MKNFKILLSFLIINTCLFSCASRKLALVNESARYNPADIELYNTIASMDSVFWDAYNSCDIELQSKLYAGDIEFYHDQAGLITSRQTILDATKSNICGKIKRELVKGSIEVYPLRGFGAVEIGEHKFYKLDDTSDSPPQAGKFIFIWQLENTEWTIKRIISLHY
ncbi:MAG: nuclear transport factor 2 family protein [Bacteroidales bacterium]|nr:nuclear transport factor 2 family protein [Bacteroidales bacterium]